MTTVTLFDFLYCLLGSVSLVYGQTLCELRKETNYST